MWMCQSRHDLKLYMSLLGTQQQSPCQGTEAALRGLLRFLRNDMNVTLRLPSESSDALTAEGYSPSSLMVHSFSDASHGPWRFNSRRGITGGVVTFQNGVVRTLARQQQSTALSSCESELYALQLVSQESVALSRLIQRVVAGLGWQHEGEIVPIVMESDSSSAIQLVQGIDLPKRSRHIEIRLEWLRDKLKCEEITLVHKQGVENVADLFTKCLPSKDFYRHRNTLGIDRVSFPVQDLAELFVEAMPKRTAYYAFLEVCCDKDSALKRACSTSGFRYLGVSSNMELLGVQRRVRDFVEQQKTEGLLVHVHVSTPCSSGSPLQNFHAGVGETETWKVVMSSASFYLSLGDQASFELPKNNQIWDRELTHKTLERSGLIFSGTVRLCKTGLIGKSCLPIGKQLRFVSTSGAFVTSLERRFGQCDCPEHAALNEVHFGKTALYSPVLARGILNAMKEGFKESGKIKR